MQRKAIIAGNWKMNLTGIEARELATAVAKTATTCKDREVMVAPPFILLQTVSEVLAGSNVHLGAQNVCWEEKGAFTGEISPSMLQEYGCDMVIIGHSERRHVFGESDRLINQRLRGALRFGLKAILCIGETLEEREQDRTFAVLEEQLRQGLEGVETFQGEQLIIAYEPVWAIGTGKTATTGQAQEVHEFVRNLLAQLYEKNIATQIRILYGGSVNAQNVDELMRQPDVDGALVGGAALKADSFERIIHFQ